MDESKIIYVTYVALSKYERDRWAAFIKRRNLPDGTYIWTGGKVAFNARLLAERTLTAIQEFSDNGLQ